MTSKHRWLRVDKGRALLDLMLTNKEELVRNVKVMAAWAAVTVGWWSSGSWKEGGKAKGRSTTLTEQTLFRVLFWRIPCRWFWREEQSRDLLDFQGLLPPSSIMVYPNEQKSKGTSSPAWKNWGLLTKLKCKMKV